MKHIVILIGSLRKDSFNKQLATIIKNKLQHYAKSKNDILGVVEATNNLLTSNMFNLFIIQSIGIIVYAIFVKKTQLS